MKAKDILVVCDSITIVLNEIIIRKSNCGYTHSFDSGYLIHVFPIVLVSQWWL